jgi:hypothetical protein
MNLTLRSFFFILANDVLYGVKSFDKGLSVTFHPKEVVLQIFIALKNPSPRPV